MCLVDCTYLKRKRSFSEVQSKGNEKGGGGGESRRRERGYCSNYGTDLDHYGSGEVERYFSNMVPVF